jgi:hypothetical protein
VCFEKLSWSVLVLQCHVSEDVQEYGLDSVLGIEKLTNRGENAAFHRPGFEVSWLRFIFYMCRGYCQVAWRLHLCGLSERFMALVFECRLVILVATDSAFGPCWTSSISLMLCLRYQKIARQRR